MFPRSRTCDTPRAIASPTPSPELSSEGELVAVDTETTGLQWYDRLVEVGAVRFRGDRVIARWQRLINPHRSVPAHVVALHGLSDDVVATAADAREVLADFQRFCGDTPLLAHNARFDRDLLAAEFVRAGLLLPNNRLYCTWRLAKRCVPDAPRHGLAVLAEHLGLPGRSTHRALPDAELTRELFLACRSRAPERCVPEALDANATEAGIPLTFRGAVRRIQRMPEALRAAREAGTPVTQGEARGVPLRAYAYGEDARVDLRAEDGSIASVAL